MSVPNSKTVCRILGWLFFALGGTGLTTGHVGTYLQFTQAEAYITMSLGVISILAARQRRRVAAVIALVTGLIYLTWGIAGVFLSHPVLGTSEPLDTLVRELAAIWGIGTAVHEAMLWRRLISSGS